MGIWKGGGSSANSGKGNIVSKSYSQHTEDQNCTMYTEVKINTQVFYSKAEIYYAN